jgi:hypothetical protein
MGFMATCPKKIKREYITMDWLLEQGLNEQEWWKTINDLCVSECTSWYSPRMNFIRQLFSDIQYNINRLVHGTNHFLRPAMIYIKHNLEGDLVGVEIGSRYGRNAEVMLNYLDMRKLYLIDPWDEYFWSNRQRIDVGLNAMDRCKQLLTPYKNKVVYVQEHSEDAVDMIPDNLDFVYIDGNHSFPYVRADLENYFPKIRNSGVIAGHDFNSDNMGVVLAVLGFAKSQELEVMGAGIDWWIKK